MANKNEFIDCPLYRLKNNAEVEVWFEEMSQDGKGVDLTLIQATVEVFRLKLVVLESKTTKIFTPKKKTPIFRVDIFFTGRYCVSALPVDQKERKRSLDSSRKM